MSKRFVMIPVLSPEQVEECIENTLGWYTEDGEHLYLDPSASFVTADLRAKVERLTKALDCALGENTRAEARENALQQQLEDIKASIEGGFHCRKCGANWLPEEAQRKGGESKGEIS